MGLTTRCELANVPYLEGCRKDQLLNNQNTDKHDNESGTSLVEYALVTLLIAIVALVGVIIAGEQVSESYSTIASSLSDANN